MANLFTGSLDFEGYKTLSSLTGITFVQGTTYTIQIQNGAYVREGVTGEGFLVPDASPFQYTARTDDLYIKKLCENSFIVVNIAD